MQGALSLVVLLLFVQATSAETWEASKEEHASGAQSSTALQAAGVKALQIRLRVPWNWRLAQTGIAHGIAGHERGEAFKAGGPLNNWWKRIGWCQERILATRAASRPPGSGCSSEADEDGLYGSEEQQQVLT